MNPTLHFRWFDASSEEELKPCATNYRGYVGPHPYVLKQWWAGDNTGEWRIVPVADDSGPPVPYKKCADKDCKNITSGVHIFCNACLDDERHRH